MYTYVLSLRYGETETSFIPVDDWVRHTDGNPICERLHVKIPVSIGLIDPQWFLETLRSVELVVELQNTENMHISKMPGSYITNIENICEEGRVFVAVDFIYPFDTRQFYLLPNDIATTRTPNRERLAMDWSRWGFILIFLSTLSQPITKEKYDYSTRFGRAYYHRQKQQYYFSGRSGCDNVRLCEF